MKAGKYPLLFTFIEPVLGNGFLARVFVRGRAVASAEGGGWWMYGVEPGDVTAGGATFAEAREGFRSTFDAILYEIAEEAAYFDAFAAEVRRFCGETNSAVEQEWRSAVDRVRTGALAELLTEVQQDRIDQLSVDPADSPRGVDVDLLSVITPQDNAQALQLAVAA